MRHQSFLILSLRSLFLSAVGNYSLTDYLVEACFVTRGKWGISHSVSSISLLVLMFVLPGLVPLYRSRYTYLPFLSKDFGFHQGSIARCTWVSCNTDDIAMYPPPSFWGKSGAISANAQGWPHACLDPHLAVPSVD